MGHEKSQNLSGKTYGAPGYGDGHYGTEAHAPVGGFSTSSSTGQAPGGAQETNTVLIPDTR